MPSWLLTLIAAFPTLIPAVISLVDEIIAIFKNNPPASAPNLVTNLQALKTDLMSVHGDALAEIKAKGIKP